MVGAKSDNSFILGFSLGWALADYNRAYIDEPRRAFLSLGDFLWRYCRQFTGVVSSQNPVRPPTEIRFKLMDLKKAQASLDVTAMESDYSEFLKKIQDAYRKAPDIAARKLALREIFPKAKHSEIFEWGSMPRSNVALWVVATKHRCQPSTLKRLLSQAKKLTAEERLRRAWLQQFNRMPPSPVRPSDLAQHFPEILLAFSTEESIRAFLSTPISSLLEAK